MDKAPECVAFRKQWYAALRSSEYAQCKGEWANGIGGYCCLGVANLISGKPLMPNGKLKPPDGQWSIGATTSKLGFDEQELRACMAMNDLANFTFQMIADTVEKAEREGYRLDDGRINNIKEFMGYDKG